MLVEPVGVTKPTVETVTGGEPRPEVDVLRQSREKKGQEPQQLRRKKEEDTQFLRDVLEVAQNHFNVSGVGLSFSVHEATGQIKVDVTDKETGELIREIPPEEVLNLMAKIDEMMGILYDDKA